MNVFLTKYALALKLAFIAILLSAIGVQTVRLSSAHSTISGLNEKAAQLQAQREKQRADDERYARAVEGQLRDTAAAIQKESDETQTVLAARVVALRDELRNRPERPAAGSAAAATGATAAGATGAGLYRDDADFLVRFSASAADIGRERDACRAQYRSAEQALKKYQAERAGK